MAAPDKPLPLNSHGIFDKLLNIFVMNFTYKMGL